jgi:hypothetical protein
MYTAQSTAAANDNNTLISRLLRFAVVVSTQQRIDALEQSD